MNSNPVVWFEIYVQDMARAKAFYEAVLEGTLEELPMPGEAAPPGMEMWAFPRQQGAAGSSGALVKMPGFPSGGNSTLVYFSCDDCAVEAARVEPQGGRIERAKMSIGPYGFIALAIDPDGNMFGLHSLQ